MWRMIFFLKAAGELFYFYIQAPLGLERRQNSSFSPLILVDILVMEKAQKRWLVDISRWNPSSHDFSSALLLLPQHERSTILRFVKTEDRKRALVSRLLQYALVHDVVGLPLEQIVIERTPEGKPYLDYKGDEMENFPNFNFNASHHGDYVAVASEPLCLVGVDIVSYTPPQSETVAEFIYNFTSYFSSSEWKTIKNAGSWSEVLMEFYRFWCVKEAFVKAVGSGVGFGLERVEFHHTNWSDIRVEVDGVELEEWRFWLHELDRRHCLCIARGHPRLATDSFKRTLKRVEFKEQEYLAGLHLPNASFVSHTVEQLISILEGAERYPDAE